MIQLGKKKAQDFMAELYLKHERLMYYIAGNYTKDLFRREDIVQAALIALMRNEATLHSLSDSARLSYIASAVRNTAINALRREQRESSQCVSIEEIPAELLHAQALWPEIKNIEMEHRQELLAKFQELHEHDRQLLFGRYLMDMTDAEMAKILGCKPSSVRMKLTRARRALLEKLKEGGSDHE